MDDIRLCDVRSKSEIRERIGSFKSTIRYIANKRHNPQGYRKPVLIDPKINKRTTTSNNDDLYYREYNIEDPVTHGHFTFRNHHQQQQQQYHQPNNCDCDYAERYFNRYRSLCIRMHASKGETMGKN